MGTILSITSLIYHIYKTCQHKKVEPKEEDVPSQKDEKETGPKNDNNDSVVKLDDLGSKRNMGENNPLIFNIEDVDDLPQTSNQSFDAKREERKTKVK